MAASSRVAAAAAWVKKYFVVASIARGWCCWAIRGIIARVLISNPIHAISQCVLVVVIVVPRSKPNIREAVMYGFICKGGILTSIFRVWA